MKKNIIFWLSFILIMLFFSPSKIYGENLDEQLDILDESEHYELVISALTTTETSTISNYNNFMSAYFDNLTYNLGMNYKGSCGYVAIAMFLSYYDTFFNDAIIPENYDIPSVGSGTNMIERRNSPGVLKDVIVNPESLDDTIYGLRLSALEYYSYMEALSNVSLHARLIIIANAKGYYNFNDDYGAAGSLFTYRLDVLNTYLGTVGYIEGIDYTIEYNDTGNYNDTYSYYVRRFTIEKIKAGYPVLLSVQRPSGLGHVVVAYEYDQATDIIYCHMGYGSDLTHVNVESRGFSVYATALVIDFMSQHSHNNNYGVTEIVNGIPTVTYYCYCSSSIHSYHQYSSHYSSINNQEHRAYCSCGAERTESHNKYISGCTKQCSNCSWSEEYHLCSYKQYNANCHHKSCSNCSLKQLENHKFTADPITYRIYCSLCGYQTNDYIQSIGYHIECILQKQIEKIK